MAAPKAKPKSAPKSAPTAAPKATRQPAAQPAVSPKKASAVKPAAAKPQLPKAPKPALKSKPVSTPSTPKPAATLPMKPMPQLAVLAAPPEKDTGKARQKLVRDSFTMPPQDFNLIAELKSRALAFGRPTKKSELLRAGLQVLNTMKPAQLQQVLGQLAPLKTGRPKKGS